MNEKRMRGFVCLGAKEQSNAACLWVERGRRKGAGGPALEEETQLHVHIHTPNSAGQIGKIGVGDWRRRVFTKENQSKQNNKLRQRRQNGRLFLACSCSLKKNAIAQLIMS